MGLFEKIFGQRKQIKAAAAYFKTLTAYQPAFTSWRGSIYEMMQCRASIDAIARNCGKLKIEIQGNAKPEIKTAIQHQPNEWQTWYQFMYRLVTILYAENTAFIVPVVDRLGDIKGIYPVLASRCALVTYQDIPYLQYEFATGQKAAMELELCGILTRFQYKDDFFGSDNKALNPAVDLIHQQNQGIKEGIKQGAGYRFTAQLGNFSTDEDLAKEKTRFNRENFEKEGGGLLLFPASYKDIKQLDPKTFIIDAEQMKAIDKNVFDYFGTNEEVLQNKAIGDGWNAFYEGCIEPFSIQFSEVLTKMFYTQREQSNGAKIMATANRLQYMSNKEKMELSVDMLDRGVFTINQVLEMWNLPTVEGGDIRIIRGEYYKASEKLNQGGSNGTS